MREKLLHASTTFLFVLFAFTMTLSGCKQPSKPKKISDFIEVVSVDIDAKWDWFLIAYWHPKVELKFRNISEEPIKNDISVKYQFIIDDEIVDEGSRILHSKTDAAWDSGLSKTLEFSYVHDSRIKDLDKTPPRVRATFVFEDNSPIWNGVIEPKKYDDYIRQEMQKKRKASSTPRPTKAPDSKNNPSSLISGPHRSYYKSSYFKNGKFHDSIVISDSYLYETKRVIKSTSYAKVDLNDYFNPEEADWNYTELSNDEWEYLRSRNVFPCDTTISNYEFKGWYRINKWTETQNIDRNL